MVHWITRLLRRRRGEVTPGQQAAEDALARAVQARQEAEERQPEVRRIARRLRAERERNHFAETFRQALQGGP